VKDDLHYVQHILECIERIQRYCVEGESAFLGSDLLQDAVLRNLQILAESTQRLSQGIKSACPGVGWRELAGFRNVLVHDYMGVNP